MKAKYRNILIGSAVATVLATTGAAFAHQSATDGGMQHGGQAQQACGGGGMGMMGHGGMKGGMKGGKHQGMGFAKGLDLSDEQKAKMSKMREEFLPRMGELQGKMQANHEQLRAQRHSDSPDQAAIATLADEKGDLVAEMIKMRSSHKAQMQALLTDEQREQMRQRRHSKGKMGKGHMGG